MRGLGSKHLAACRAFAFLVVRPENSKYIFLSLTRACIQLGGVCQGTEQNQTRNTVL